MKPDDGFIIGDTLSIEELKETQKSVVSELHKDFIELEQCTSLDPIKVLDMWGNRLAQEDLSQIAHIFRIKNTPNSILEYRDADYKIARSKMALYYYEVNKGCSLFDLIGIIKVGKISGRLYISPQIVSEIDRTYWLSEEFFLFRKKNHFAIAISDEFNNKDLTTDRIKCLLECTSSKFKDTKIDVISLNESLEKGNSIEDYYGNLIKDFYNCDLFNEQEYHVIRKSIEKLHADFTYNSGKVVNQLTTI